jgi:hypothetical protein
MGLDGLTISMAIDFRTSRRKYPSRALWYKKDTSKDEILSRSKKADGVFYGRDVVDFMSQEGMVAGMVKFDSSSLTIETEDDIDIKQNDFVVYEEKLFIVINVVMMDVERGKYLSRRPFSVRRITLRK